MTGYREATEEKALSGVVGLEPARLPPSRRVVAFDGLRGVAALMVLLHHTLLMLPDFANFEWYGPRVPTYGWGEWLLLRTPLRLMWGGQERAILFFVLSGFVLSIPWLDGRPPQYGKFLVNRFCRIYPPYIIAMALAVVASTLIGGHRLPDASVYFNQLGWAFKPSWGAVPSIVAILNNHSSEYMNEAIWSLMWEVRVAFIFPFAILAIVRWRNFGVVAVLAALTVLKLGAGHLVSPEMSGVLNEPDMTFFYADYFIAGAAVALNRARIESWFGRRPGAYGLACFVMGCLICWLPWPVLDHPIVGCGAAIILASILGSAQLRGWLVKAPLLWLGRQSYSLYLTHVPVIMSLAIAFHGSVPVAACLGVMPLAIVVAEIFRRVAEAPSVRLAHALTGTTRKRPERARAIAAETPSALTVG